MTWRRGDRDAGAIRRGPRNQDFRNQDFATRISQPGSRPRQLRLWRDAAMAAARRAATMRGRDSRERPGRSSSLGHGGRGLDGRGLRIAAGRRIERLRSRSRRLGRLFRDAVAQPGLSARAGGEGYGRERNERGFLDRASDEVASWFGDRDAERRREMDTSRLVARRATPARTTASARTSTTA